MNETNKEIWIIKGYELFALHGLSNIKIETLVRFFNKNYTLSETSNSLVIITI
jgi:fucose permease